MSDRKKTNQFLSNSTQDANSWEGSVSEKSLFDMSNLWMPKFKIHKTHKIITLGSSFSQYISEYLHKNNYSWYQPEKPPYGLSKKNIVKYNYSYSARTGDILTASLLHQWIYWSFKPSKCPQKSILIQDNIFDPFRPTIEPKGFQSKNEMLLSRNQTLESLNKSLLNADCCILTISSIISLIDKNEIEYPVTIKKIIDNLSHYSLKPYKHNFNEIKKYLEKLIMLIRSKNPLIKIIFTVSPVVIDNPKSSKHPILDYSTSKSTILTAISEIEQEYNFVDYFPAYEIMTSHVFRGLFFTPNNIDISNHGMEFICTHFFKAIIEKA